MQAPEAYATDDKKSTIVSEDDKKQSEKNAKNEGDKEEKESVERSAVKTDSSHHSISKYNFLFYMVYKVKYGELNESAESKQAIAEE